MDTRSSSESSDRTSRNLAKPSPPGRASEQRDSSSRWRSCLRFGPCSRVRPIDSGFVQIEYSREVKKRIEMSMADLAVKSAPGPGSTSRGGGDTIGARVTDACRHA